MLKVIVFFAVFATCYGRPEIDTQNVVTVPPNCPDGQQWINGQCREIWRQGKNVVSVPPNCNPGEELINGECREVWRSGAEWQPSETGPYNCPPGFEFLRGMRAWCHKVSSGKPLSQALQYLRTNPGEESIRTSSHNLLRRASGTDDTPAVVTSADRNIISVPNQCPAGYRPDALGICRPVFDM